LKPESFVDWYDEMENELMLITKITLMPFDAIAINWQYVGLCIPGVGEKVYLAMAKVLWRICKRTLPHDEDAVQDAFKLSSGRVQDGFKIIWDVLVRSQPAFCPWKRYYEPHWSETRDIVTHSKRWTLFFRFMSKSEVGYSSDTECSLFFLRSIQEPAFLSQRQSLEVCIINENNLAPTKLKGRAPLPTHLQIPALTETIKQTMQPISFTETINRLHATPPYFGPLVPYNPTLNQHMMQGFDEYLPHSNWTERRRGNARRESQSNNPRKRQDGKRGDSGTRNRSTPEEKPKVICQACFVPGHEAVTCWTLARALLAADFIHNLVDKEVLTRVVVNYKQRFRPPESARANRLCQDTLWTYCIDHHTSPEYVCKQLNWPALVDSWDESEEEDPSDTEGDPDQEE
jgi:hypothetical protein